MLFLEERRRAILDQIEQTGRVTVNELSEALQVSAVTIRQDLRALQNQGLLERTYGGAVARTSINTLQELSFNVRRTRMNKQKQAIAAAAAALVHDGYSIALDSSTSTYALVPHLTTFNKLTLLTNGLAIVQSFLDTSDQQVRVLLTGGRLRREAASVVGMPDGLPDVNLNLGFFGARGIAETVGVSEIDPDEVLIKKALVARCMHPVFLIDGSKWGQVAPYTIASTAEIQHVITSDDAPADQVERLRARGIRVDVVTP